MAPKRRSAGAKAVPSQQRTLSFQGKTTKLSSKKSSDSVKDDKQKAEQTEAAAVEHDQKLVEESIKKPTTAQRVIEQQVEEEKKTLEAAPDPIEETGKDVKAADVLGGKAKQDDKGAVGGKGAGWVADEEAQARKISDAQIKRYWRQKEQERIVPRVHQDDLTVYEKVLREFDMSGQFGPCIGIARLKRWKRANLLGLKPPMEVLAVLLRQLEGDTKSQRAHVDELMSSRFIET